MRITQRIFDLYFGGICDDERVIQRRAGAISETTSESKRILLKEIGSKWDKFSAHNLSALKHTHDLVPQVVENLPVVREYPISLPSACNEPVRLEAPSNAYQSQGDTNEVPSTP